MKALCAAVVLLIQAHQTATFKERFGTWETVQCGTECSKARSKPIRARTSDPRKQPKRIGPLHVLTFP